MKKGKQGFASMTSDRKREIASMGGKAQGKHNNPANFARDPERARRAGQVGGKVTLKDRVVRDSRHV